MKIDKRIPPTQVGKVSGTSAKSGVKSARARGAEGLSLSESGTRIRALESQLASVDVTDTGKIESVKAALAGGSFKVDAEVVADRLIEQTKATLARRPRKKTS